MQQIFRVIIYLPRNVRKIQRARKFISIELPQKGFKTRLSSVRTIRAQISKDSGGDIVAYWMCLSRIKGSATMCAKFMLTMAVLTLAGMICEASLRVGAFNIRIFGKTKMGKSAVKAHLVDVSAKNS